VAVAAGWSEKQKVIGKSDRAGDNKAQIDPLEVCMNYGWGHTRDARWTIMQHVVVLSSY